MKYIKKNNGWGKHSEVLRGFRQSGDSFLEIAYETVKEAHNAQCAMLKHMSYKRIYDVLISRAGKRLVLKRNEEVNRREGAL